MTSSSSLARLLLLLTIILGIYGCTPQLNGDIGPVSPDAADSGELADLRIRVLQELISKQYLPQGLGETIQSSNGLVLKDSVHYDEFAVKFDTSETSEARSRILSRLHRLSPNVLDFTTIDNQNKKISSISATPYGVYRQGVRYTGSIHQGFSGQSYWFNFKRTEHGFLLISVTAILQS